MRHLMKRFVEAAVEGALWDLTCHLAAGALAFSIISHTPLAFIFQAVATHGDSVAVAAGLGKE